MTKRQAAILALELGLILAVVYRERLPMLSLAAQRGAYIACQQAARGFGMLAIELEKNYRVKVAP